MSATAPELASPPSPPRGRRNAVLRLAGRKLALLIGVFFGATLLLFAAIKAVPGDPVALRLKRPDPERVAQMRADLGLDQPLLIQYGAYLERFVTGDWGRSLISGRTVASEIGTFFPATLELALTALVLGALGGIVLALSAEALGLRGLRKFTRALGALGLTVPIFWLGLLFLLAGSYALGWFPGGGRFDFARVAPEGTGFLLLDTLLAGRFDLFLIAVQHLALPVLTLALYPAALVSGVMAERFAEPRLQTLVRALRAKGLSPWQIWGKHVLRLLAAPLITVLGTNFGALLGGAVLTETVYSWPGMGRYLVEAVLNRDIFVLESGLLLIILLAFAVVSLADVLATAANPLARSTSS